MNNSLSDRIKENYENRFRHSLPRRIPVIIRVDGKAFHTLTKAFNKPFDGVFSNAMVSAATATANQMQGFKLAFVQSDEVQFLLTDYDKLTTDAWFDYNMSKIESISASYMTAYFNYYLNIYLLSEDNVYAVRVKDMLEKHIPVFDSRSFSCPKEEVSNAFLFRLKDCQRNSLSSYCQSLFSHKELQNKNSSDMHEMLHKIGKNWTKDLTDKQKNGTIIVKLPDGFSFRNDILPTFESINEIVKPFLESQD